ncbi:MAG: DUF3043 domain-containing protein [Actinomycetota bacterium]|nr:DUF3043 domain-containing protein [Acidothermales bacterium]MDQ3432618.1 DUF3043 domain-containing protein [Actinomycetota bacterium]
MLRRRRSADAVAEPGGATAYRPDGDKAGGKGRPTPRRRDAEQKRRTAVRAPRDRREALRLARDKSRRERADARRALLSGDEKALPPRDRGPVRRFARDYVDSRRRAGEFFLPGCFVVLVLSAFRDPRVSAVGNLLWLLLVVSVVMDSVRVARSVKREVRQRYPGEETRGLAPYAVMRGLQLRRLRLPRPRVKPGTPLPR